MTRYYDSDGIEYKIIDPDDSAVYTFDYSDNLATGETISSAVVTAATGLTVTATGLTATGDGVNITVSGGTAGTEYDAVCKVTTSTSRVRSITGRFKCRER